MLMSRPWGRSWRRSPTFVCICIWGCCRQHLEGANTRDLYIHPSHGPLIIAIHPSHFPVTGSYRLHDGLTSLLLTFPWPSMEVIWWSISLLTSHTLRTVWLLFALKIFLKGWKEQGARAFCFALDSPHRILFETEAELVSWTLLDFLPRTVFPHLLLIH